MSCVADEEPFFLLEDMGKLFTYKDVYARRVKKDTIY